MLYLFDRIFVLDAPLTVARLVLAEEYGYFFVIQFIPISQMKYITVIKGILLI